MLHASPPKTIPMMGAMMIARVALGQIARRTNMMISMIKKCIFFSPSLIY
jgi:hypothetical protein